MLTPVNPRRVVLKAVKLKPVDALIVTRSAVKLTPVAFRNLSRIVSFFSSISELLSLSDDKMFDDKSNLVGCIKLSEPKESEQILRRFGEFPFFRNSGVNKRDADIEIVSPIPFDFPVV